MDIGYLARYLTLIWGWAWRAWKLREDDGGEDERAARDLGGRKGVAEREPSADRPDNRLEAHEDCGNGRIGARLAEVLHRVGDSAGHDGDVEKREPSGAEVLERKARRLGWKQNERRGADSGASGTVSLP